ncbi:hypothetical protein BH23ACT12_BH23ACT12_09540 [soil metagenome]
MNDRNPVNDRDEELGGLLRLLEVPDHGPDFFTGLDALLEVEAENIREERRRHARRNFSLLGVAAAILVGILFTTWVGIPGRKGPSILGPDVATAAEVQRQVAQAFATTSTLQGTLETVASAPLAPSRKSYTFSANAGGDYAYESTDGLERAAFVASDGTLREVMGFEDNPGRFVAFEERGMPPSLRFRLLDRELGSVVRAFLQEGSDAEVEEITHNGREAWMVSLDVTETRFAESPDHLNIVVDRETGFPVDVEARRDGNVLRHTRIDGLVLNRPLPENRFRLEFPGPNQLIRLDRVDAGFRRVDPGAAQGVTGYPPLIPASRPRGFEGPIVAVANSSTISTGDEGMNPPSEDVTNVTYRRGLDRLVVDVYRTGPDPSAWTDPISGGESTVETPEVVTLSSGFLEGQQANIVIEPGTPPHLWVVTDEFVVTVSGDLTRSELIKTAESLARY